MGVVYGDRVQETFTTTGTGAISLAGAVTGYQAFSAKVANAGTCYYSANDGTNWEVGLGTYATSGNTLTRTTILDSSTGSAINWAAGTKNIFLTFPALAANAVTSNVPQGQITGFIANSIGGSNTTALLATSAGQATDSTGAALISRAAASWNVANGNAINGYQGGTTLPNSSTIHFYVCSGASGTGIFASLSATAPVLPSGYNTYFRRIFSLNTNGSGALIPGTMVETAGGGYTFLLTTQLLDIGVTNLISANRTLFALTVPSGLKLEPIFRAVSGTARTAGSILFTCPDETDVAASNGSITFTTAPGYDTEYITGTGSPGTAAGGQYLLTNTSAQIGARTFSGTGTSLYWTTRGHKDPRRV